MRTVAVFLLLATSALAGCFGADEDLPPRISLVQRSGAYPNGEPATAFVVAKVDSAVDWSDLLLFCPDGTGPEPWGGDRSHKEGPVEQGQVVYCDGSGLSIVHVPTDTLLYDAPTLASAQASA